MTFPLKVLVLERESAAGGIPRHCESKPRLRRSRDMKTFITGPAYARKLVEKATAAGVDHPHQRHGHRLVRRAPALDGDVRRKDANASILGPSFWPPAPGRRPTPRPDDSG